MSEKKTVEMSGGSKHLDTYDELVVVDQFTPRYQFRPTLNFLEEDVYYIIDNHQMDHLHL